MLLHDLLMPRRMHQPLARAMAAEGLHVVTLDLLGHGRSDQPADPLVYSVGAFAEQVVALLDHLGADQAVIGGTSLGANVALETAVLAPQRVKGPAARDAGARQRPRRGRLGLRAHHVRGPLSALHRQRPSPGRRSVPRGLVPFWTGVGLESLDRRADSTAALLHGIVFGRIAPPSSQRRRIHAPALVVGHPTDPMHPFVDADMLAAELPHVRFEQASSIVEWRAKPGRLTRLATAFTQRCWEDRSGSTELRVPAGDCG